MNSRWYVFASSWPCSQLKFLPHNFGADKNMLLCTWNKNGYFAVLTQIFTRFRFISSNFYHYMHKRKPLFRYKKRLSPFEREEFTYASRSPSSITWQLLFTFPPGDDICSISQRKEQKIYYRTVLCLSWGHYKTFLLFCFYLWIVCLQIRVFKFICIGKCVAMTHCWFMYIACLA